MTKPNYKERIETATANAEFTFDRLNTSLANIVFRAAPLVAPAPSAIAIYNAVLPEWGLWSALFVALGIEALGFGAAETALRVWYLNRALGHTQIKQWIPNALFAGYFIVALATIFFFEAMPAIASRLDGGISAADLAVRIAPIVYPFLTVIGAGLYGLRSLIADGEDELGKREQRQDVAVEFEQEKERAEWEMEMEKRKAEQALALEKARSNHEAKLDADRKKLDAKLAGGSPSKSVQKTSVQPFDSREKLSKLDALDIILDMYKADGRTPLRDVGQAIGRSPQTVSNWLSDLEQAGTIHRNGNGVEVLR